MVAFAACCHEVYIALQALRKPKRGRKSRPRMSNSVAGALKQHDKELELLGQTTELVEEQVGCRGASNWALARARDGPDGC